MQRMARIVLVMQLGISLSLGTACTGTKVTPGQPVRSGIYRVGPPDTLRITVLPAPEMQQTVTVRPDGNISFDLVGDIPASGRTVEEIAADIEGRISRFKRDARVTVYLAGARSTAITILGEVPRQTTIALTRQTRLIEAIGQVGGWTARAAASRTRIVRTLGEKPGVYSANLKHIIKGDLRTNYMLQGGDIVVVPPTYFARVGYAVAQLLFPLTSLFSLGKSAAGTAVMIQTGGASAAIGAGFQAVQ